MKSYQNTPELDAFIDTIQAQRKLAESSAKKYRQKLGIFHEETCKTPFKDITFFKNHLELLITLINLQSPSSARSTFSAFYACCLTPERWIKPGYERSARLFKAGMELLNQKYQDEKKVNPHSEKQLKNWAKLKDLFKLQTTLYRRACKVKRDHPEGSRLKWRDFKDIQNCLILTLYINHRKAKESYPPWFVLADPSMNLPDENQPSLPAPKRLEWAYVEVTDTSSTTLNNLPSDKNLLLVGGERHDRKRLWFAKQKNKREHYEPINKMLNGALNLQLWGKTQLQKERVNQHTRLLITERGDPLKPRGLADFLKQACLPVSNCMTATLLRHIVAEETGHDSNAKKQVEEQMIGMNHSEKVHNLVYST
jgi:hypothetical protein